MSVKSFQKLYELALASAGQQINVSRSKTYNEISIGALERGVRTLAKKLKLIGLSSEIDVFKTGRGGAQHYGPSYVTLMVTGIAPSKHVSGDTHEVNVHLKFYAGGYDDAGNRRGTFGGGTGWTFMSNQAQTYIMKELISRGWKFPGVSP